MMREDVQGARSLLEAGADPGLVGIVWESRKKKRLVKKIKQEKFELGKV